jgi:TonB-linked SusC/RagA family outer membrane protein
MKLKFNGFLVLLLVLVAQLTFAQERAVSGVISDNTGLPLPGVSVLVKGTKTGTQSDFDGKFSIKATPSQVLVFSYVGMKTQEVAASSSSINVKLQNASVELEGVVVTALGMKSSTKKVTYAVQEIKAQDLNVTQNNDVKASLAGKIAGVQNVGQAGSKLGDSGRLRLRGAMSVKGTDNDALYVIDGVISSSENVDPENIENITVLKGPNATALYGGDGVNGVVMITTKKGKKGTVSVEVYNSTTFDKVAYLPKYQNSYGQGYSGENTWIPGLAFDSSIHPAEWASMPTNVRYNGETDADESWGPKFDGQPYLPWYTWHANSPYFAQPQAWSAQKDNIKNFFETGVSTKNGLTISGGGENFTARLNYTKTNQTGIIPNSTYGKDMISASFSVDASDKLKLGTNITYSLDKVQGDFDDGYSNNTTGSFNSWFGRDLDMGKMKELRDLKSTHGGYSATWNYWAPDYYDPAFGITPNDGVYKRVFWFNPYFWLDNYKPETKNSRMIGDINASYKFNKNITGSVLASTNSRSYENIWKQPFILEYNSAHNLYTTEVNSFGFRKFSLLTNTIQSSLDFNYKLTDDLNIKSTFGHIWRDRQYSNISANMRETGNILAGTQVGLVIPDLYTFENSRQRVNSLRTVEQSRQNTLFNRTVLDYKNFLSFNFDFMNLWDSRFDYKGLENSNYLPYGSIGASFVFSEFIKSDVLTFGKIFGSYARTAPNMEEGSVLNPTYIVGSTTSYGNNPLMYQSNNTVALGVKPHASPSIEIGTDLKFFNNRLKLNAVYYNEVREKQIIPIGISSTTGYANLIDNSGKTTRNGVELVLGVTPIKTDNFNWELTVNWAKNKTIVNSVASTTTGFEVDRATFDGVVLMNIAGQEWGQLVGNGIATDANGNPILTDSGLYVTEANKNFGSVLPDFTGGIYNKIDFHNFTLAGTISFQKGGKFFSLSERWGTNTGLLEETAALNDRGANVRDTPYNASAPVVGEDGGVHVVGVDEAGAAFDSYIDAGSYFKQFHDNNIAERNIHSASFMKLGELSLSYNLPKKYLGKQISGLSIGVVGRNLARFGLAKDNKHGWDPSEMSKLYGENGQLPGTKSYGFNIKLTL